jgi:hypothetical protein
MSSGFYPTFGDVVLHVMKTTDISLTDRVIAAPTLVPGAFRAPSIQGAFLSDYKVI